MKTVNLIAASYRPDGRHFHNFAERRPAARFTDSARGHHPS